MRWSTQLSPKVHTAICWQQRMQSLTVHTRWRGFTALVISFMWSVCEYYVHSCVSVCLDQWCSCVKNQWHIQQSHCKLEKLDTFIEVNTDLSTCPYLTVFIQKSAHSAEVRTFFTAYKVFQKQQKIRCEWMQVRCKQNKLSRVDGGIVC